MSSSIQNTLYTLTQLILIRIMCWKYMYHFALHVKIWDREFRSIPQGHKVSKWQSWGWTQSGYSEKETWTLGGKPMTGLAQREPWGMFQNLCELYTALSYFQQLQCGTRKWHNAKLVLFEQPQDPYRHKSVMVWIVAPKDVAFQSLESITLYDKRDSAGVIN